MAALVPGGAMGLRFAADFRSLLWVAIAAALVGLQIARPELAPYLFWLSCYFALACGVMAHNHNHCPTFKGKSANETFGIILSVFYGYPTFAWIPTHNLNHHKYVNKAGDATITWRYSKKHTFWVALIYPFVSGYYQSGPTKEFIDKAREKNRKLYRRIMTQYFGWIGAHAALLGTSIALNGFKLGFQTWALCCLIPALFALWTIMLFNYEQHVNTDPWSEHNHSRSFSSPTLNFLLFNNGYHAAHHEYPGVHWTKLKELHEKMAPEIDSRLIESSVWWYWFRQYALAWIIPSLGTVQVGRAPFDPPEGSSLDLKSGNVDAEEMGTNAAMVRQ